MAEEKSVMDQQENNTGQNELRIVRGRVDSLSLYEITDHEFDVLEKGSPESFHLNFGIFLLSSGLSFLVTLLSQDIQQTRIFIVFVVISSVGIILGSFLISQWYRTKNKQTDIVRKIRQRISKQKADFGAPDESKD